MQLCIDFIYPTYGGSHMKLVIVGPLGRGTCRDEVDSDISVLLYF